MDISISFKLNLFVKLDIFSVVCDVKSYIQKEMKLMTILKYCIDGVTIST